MKTLHIVIIILAIALLIQNGICQTNKVTWYSFNMGYAEPKSGDVAIKSVVGQSFIGTTQQSNTQVISGFLADTLLRGTIVSVKEQVLLPVSYSLWQNYPNPFNPSTKIQFELPKESYVTLKVYNMLGQEVMKLVDEIKPVGTYEISLDGSVLPSGVYFYRLYAGDPIHNSQQYFISTMKLILLK